MHLKLDLRFLIYISVILVGNFDIIFAGKTAARSGAAAASRIDGSQFNKEKDTVHSKDNGGIGEHVNVLEPKTLTQKLKNDLLRGYDKSVMPLLNQTDNMRIKVGFTYRQVLDLDEKNQILKSLVWYRLFWVDQLMTWDPEEYENIKEIEIPCSQIWMPDIVMYEEIGVRDYSPRLPYVRIKNNGLVSYLEPTVFETSCNIDTAFFPFDIQACHMTFVSWTQSILHVDLLTDRPQDKMSADASTFFINTGEWRFVKLIVMKTVTDYSSLLSHDSVAELEKEKSQIHPNHNESMMTVDLIQPGVYRIPVDTPATSTLLGGIKMSADMFSEVKFTITLRRNSSLYMQSMLFPSILLTTVAVLGFYLPPDSGERIGLQITILLTFMVFLLAVGEMFPASTGPYLGVYFVICMGLLGLNLLMTVMVLNIHFKPVILNAKRSKHIITKGSLWSRISRKKTDDDPSMRMTCNNSVVSIRLRQILQFCDRHWSLGEKTANWMKPIYTKMPCDREYLKENEALRHNKKSPTCSLQLDDSSSIDSSCHDDTTCKNEILNEPDDVTQPRRSLQTAPNYDVSYSTPDLRKSNGATNKELTKANSLLVETKQLSSPMATTVTSSLLEKENDVIVKNSSDKVDVNRGKAKTKHRGSILPDRNVLANLKNYIHTKTADKHRKRDCQGRIERKKWKSVREEREEMESLEHEEWKSVARAIDTLFFRVYVLFIIISHCGLAIVAFHAWCVGE